MAIVGAASARDDMCEESEEPCAVLWKDATREGARSTASREHLARSRDARLTPTARHRREASVATAVLIVYVSALATASPIIAATCRGSL
jgi:hypothetical protein